MLQGNQTPLLLQFMAQGWGGGTAWPQVPPCRDQACSESSAPLKDLRDQRPEAMLLGEWGPESAAGCDVDPLPLGELRQVRSPFPTSVSPPASLQTPVPLSAALEKGARSQYPKSKQQLIRVRVAWLSVGAGVLGEGTWGSGRGPGGYRGVYRAVGTREVRTGCYSLVPDVM